MTGASGIDEARMIDALLPRVADDPRGLLHLARRMQGIGQGPRATQLCASLLDRPDLAPDIAVQAQDLIADAIPPFHAPMIFDRVRNRAYQAALDRAMRPGMRVLEIGTGAGLLAMMAVRAGAGHVYTCEADPLLARVAAQVIAANGLSDRITVIPRHSSSLDADADLGGRADLLVSEILGDRVIDEGVLPAHADAVARLLVPGAPVIPLRGMIRVALVTATGTPAPALQDVEGFDLSAFARLRRRTVMRRPNAPGLALSSAPVDLFRLPFDGSAPLAGRTSATCIATGGPISGILQWIAFDLDDATSYDNHPHPDATSHWWTNYHPFAVARETAAGDAIVVHGRYDRARLTVWTD